MSDLPRIDVIIPAYKAQNTILRTLCSTCEQSIVNDLDVTIVNDGDEEGYQKYIDMFSPYMNIREIKLNKNMGPCCRQKGIEATHNPLFTCIDADDNWSGCFALKTLRAQLLAEPHNVCCYSNFLEEQPDAYIQHPNDSVWFFGKLFLRSFIEKYNIHIKEGLNSNEDNQFNMMCKLLANPNEQIKYISDITYYWRYKEDSITRKNNADYSYNGEKWASFYGYATGMIYAIQHAEKKNPFNPQILMQKIQVMISLYEYLIEVKDRRSEHYKNNWKWCKEFYKQVYREVKDKISDEIFSSIYNDCMRNFYAGNKLNGIIPALGVREFLEKLEEEYQEDLKKEKKNLVDS